MDPVSVRTVGTLLAAIIVGAFGGGFLGALFTGNAFAWGAKMLGRLTGTVCTVTLAVLLSTQSIDVPQVGAAYRTAYAEIAANVSRLGDWLRNQPAQEKAGSPADAKQATAAKGS